MSTTLHLLKVVAAVVMIIAGTAALVWALPYALPLFVGGIAWTQIPE